MVAFHFPPQSGSSGVQRALRFAQELPLLGWDVVVLTASPRSYESCSPDLIADVPPSVRVIRAPAWDAARHFAVARRYPSFLARPDRWVTWWPGAVVAGLGAVRRHRPVILWSTYPVATAHMIAGTLARLCRLPWVADFRDPMSQPAYPPDARIRHRLALLERRTVERARRCTFTTPGAVEAYRERYPGQCERMALIENGYDEGSFGGLAAAGPLHAGRLTLLHSGVVYASERDPSQLIRALASLREQVPGAYRRLLIRFRGAADEGRVQELARRWQVEDAIECLPAFGYRDSLGEMLSADGLLLLQASNCNAQIPAKFYEYLRARRPILALTDPRGDTSRSMHSAGLDTVAPLDDAGAIAALLRRFVNAHATLPVADAASVLRASRAGRARQLRDLFKETLAAC
jgi:glycosyltransferase involved in cell wall biosynthesis